MTQVSGVEDNIICDIKQLAFLCSLLGALLLLRCRFPFPQGFIGYLKGRVYFLFDTQDRFI